MFPPIRLKATEVDPALRCLCGRCCPRAAAAALLRRATPEDRPRPATTERPVTRRRTAQQTPVERASEERSSETTVIIAASSVPFPLRRPRNRDEGRQAPRTTMPLYVSRRPRPTKLSHKSRTLLHQPKLRQIQ